MGTGYTRNDTSNNIADGNIINAADLDGEFDAIESAFGTSGHTHDGTSAEGGPITVLGPVQDFVASATEIKPKTTNTLDIGTNSLLFKDMFLDGVATLGSIKIDNAGTIGSASDSDAIAISSGGVVSFSQNTIGKTGSGHVLSIQTSHTTMESGDVLGKIEFSAPDEASGTDAILVGASIEALAEDTFSSSVNSSALVFKTNTSAAATERMRIKSLDVAGDIILDAAGGEVRFADGSQQEFVVDMNDAATKTILRTLVSDADLVFEGNDGGAGFTALTLDMSEAGAATFNSAIGVGSAAATGYAVDVTGLSGYDDIMRLTAVGTNIGARINLTSTGTGVNRINATNNSLALQTGGTSRITIDSSGNVGIGQSPNMKLNILHADEDGIRLNTADGAASFIDFGDASDNDIGRISYDHADNHMAFRTNNAERMRIDSSGNVGIGTNLPDTLLHLSGADTAVIRLENSDSSLVADQLIGGLEFEKTDGSGAGVGVVGGVRMHSEGSIGQSTYLAFSVASSSSNNYEAMRIDSLGDIGIGTTDPRHRLDIEDSATGAIPTNADMGASNENGNYFSFHNENNSATFSGLAFETRTSGASKWLIANEWQSTYLGDLVFRVRDGGTSSSEVMRIDSSGRVGIGGTPNTSWRDDIANQKVLMLGTEATLFSDAGVTTELYNNALVNDSDTIVNISTRGASRYYQYQGAHKWYTAASASAGSNINTEMTTPKMTLDVSGNVGIGATTVDEMLHLEKTSGTTLVKTEVGGNSTVGFEIKKTGSTTSNWRIVDGQTVNGKLEIYDVTDSRSIMTFDGDGNVGIGTISPIADLSIVDSSTGSGIEIQPEVTTNTNRITNYDRVESAYKKFRLDALEHAFYVSGTERIRIEDTGSTVRFGGTTNAGYVDFDSSSLQLNTQRNPNTGSFTNTGRAHTSITLSDGNGTAANSYIRFMTSESNNTTATERVRIKANGNVGIGTTSPASRLHLNASSGVDMMMTRTSGATSGQLGNIRFGNTNVDSNLANIGAHQDGATDAAYLTFETQATGAATAERMRILSTGDIRMSTNSQTTAFYLDHSSDDIIFGSSSTGNSNAYFGNLHSADNFFYAANNSSNTTTPPIFVNRQNNDGLLILFRQGDSDEGSIEVSGSTVSLNGFSGKHESSGISTSVEIGTVVSTIDELDVYPNTQLDVKTGEEIPNPKAGQTRTDHAKVKVSDREGDTRVYGVVNKFTPENKVMVTSLGIGSVKVTGACAGGDLLESNGDGTAKVQSDDIIRSKTIGKVTIGNSNTGVKLVSCVLYCG